MINLLEGVPGSGKSYEAVVYHVLPALKSGRKVITNLPLNLEAFGLLYPEFLHLIEIRKTSLPILGKWDAEAAGRGQLAFRVGEFDLQPTVNGNSGELTFQKPILEVDENSRPFINPPKFPLFQSVWDFYDTWRGANNIGPLYVIDEAHVSFPKLTRNNNGTPIQVIEWFKLHRHFGADVLLVTQRMKALEEEIAGLSDFHVRIRKAGFLGRNESYIRKVFAGYFGGEVSVEERQYQPQYFPLYKSHTQGATVIEHRDTDVQPAHLKWRKWSRIFMLVSLFGFAYVGYKIFLQDDTQKKSSLQKITIPSNEKISFPQTTKATIQTSSTQVAEKSSLSTTTAEVLTDPLATKSIHMTGCMYRKKDNKTLCTFSVSQNGSIVFSLTSDELTDIGYHYETLGHCTGSLKWKTEPTRTIICDSPAVALKVANIR